MSSNLRLEKQILSYVRDSPSHSGASAARAHFMFPDTLQEIPLLNCATNEKARENWNRLENALNALSTRQWIVLTQPSKIIQEAILTKEGHERLDWHWSREFPQVLYHLLSGAFRSIALPIIVAVATVLVLDWIGIGDHTDLAPDKTESAGDPADLH